MAARIRPQRFRWVRHERTPTPEEERSWEEERRIHAPPPPRTEHRPAHRPAQRESGSAVVEFEI
ncbi:hypothetical protein G6O69_18185 [Pseudenhygromyxa sp. WMMC2535]|uniref:hypothetical protein n=1 Tax=Pseudenhygromyxa sp. WMMC2535 TaxID=2712867 RepID=UPI0015950F01|nr:hypothetical protein [Pseudenhygromyxa sp. WMMC2535]NVB39779.1 hypothetical protein [Pseudenhygromyxa sp. WMMC2535]